MKNRNKCKKIKIKKRKNWREPLTPILNRGGYGILASRPDQWCRCRHCPHPRYRQRPHTCATVRTKQNDFGSFLPQMWVWTVPSDDEDAQFVEFVVGAPDTTRRNRRSRRHRLAHVHVSKHTVEFNRNRFQWERAIRKPGHRTLNSVSWDQPGYIWESSNNVDINTIQFAQLSIESHEPHGDWFAFRSC